MERREGKLTSIADLIERNIILRGADVLSQRGFTQVPNHILVSTKLSPGAKLAYAMLIKYAWQNDYCFPGQARLATDMGVTDRSVRTYLQELELYQFISIKRQGLGKVNLYEIHLAQRVPSLGGKIFRSRSEINSSSRSEKSSD